LLAQNAQERPELSPENLRQIREVAVETVKKVLPMLLPASTKPRSVQAIEAREAVRLRREAQAQKPQQAAFPTPAEAPAPAAEPEYLEAKDAMEHLGVCRQTFFDYVRRGYIDRKKLPGMVARYPRSQCTMDSIINRKAGAKE
jgi:hypothetical protein